MKKAKNKIITPAAPDPKIGIWKNAAVIAKSDFKFKSLCDWSLNVAVGCSHGCAFCYVPAVSATKQKNPLAEYGVSNPDLEWGTYVLVREWDEAQFLASLQAAENTPQEKLKADGHRCVMFCTTTDAYQIIRHPDSKKQKELQNQLNFIVRRALELILTESTLNVRILTRSPLAKGDFELYKKFGNRLLFGMSIPSLNNDLVRKYEPHAPAPTQRLKTLRAAKEAGLNVFVAIAPTFPECDEADLRATLEAVKELDPVTIFHEPINIRGENVERMSQRMEKRGDKFDYNAFATDKAWMEYAVRQLRLVEQIANEIGVSDKLHLWPDKDLRKERFLEYAKNPWEFLKWLDQWHNRISEWPEGNL